VGVEDLLASFSEGLASIMESLFVCGVEGLVVVFSGDFTGLTGLPEKFPLSKKELRSLTWPVCSDCMRLWAAPLIRERSGDASGRFRSGTMFVMYPLSRAFSVNAACAD